MKQLLFLFLTFILPLKGGAREAWSLQIWQKDGNVQSISFTDEPVTTFSDGNLVVTTITTTITMPLEQVSKYTFITDTDGIADIKTENVTISQDGESITFDNLKPGTEITIHNASGMLIQQQKVEQGTTTVSVANLPIGVYIVKANGITYKIMKR